MGVLLDTSGVVLVLRRHPPPGTGPFVEATRAEILEALLHLPSVILPVEAALVAGNMGSFLARQGASIPFPDLLVAATAIWLDLPLLTWDGDFARARGQAQEGGDHPGAQAWRHLALHPASRSA